MKTRLVLLRALFAVVPAVLLGQGAAVAQEQNGPGDRGRVELGVRQLFGDRASSKFQEYREIPQGWFIQHSEVTLGDLLNNTFFFNFQSRDTRENDQSYLFNLGEYRKYRLDLRWDQTPHVFTTTAKSFFLESSPGVYIAPRPLANYLQANPGDLQSLLDNARPLDMSLRRDKGGGTFTFSPSMDWDLQLGYSKEKQVGTRPFGTTTNQFTNTIELPEPIDYRTHQVKAGAEYGKENFGFQASYLGSFFRNQISTLIWDNPFRAVDAVSGSTKGRLDLYPDNSANSLSFAGAANLPGSTRVMASVVPGWIRQNDAFLPFTINPAIPGVPALPATSLNGKRDSLSMNYTLNSRAIPSVPVTFRYRSWDYDNETPSLIFPGYVATDSAVTTVARRNLPFAYDRKNLRIDASWEFLRKSSLKLFYEWERFDRHHRDVERSHEDTWGASIDFNPRHWVLLRTSYKHAQRSPEHYEANEEGFPLGEPATALAQLPLLRKFDEAARERDRGEALITLTPVDQIDFTTSYGTTQDDYNRSSYGLLKDIRFNYSFELSYLPHPAASLFANYTRERYKSLQRSRQRNPPSATAPANDSTNNDWESNLRDIVDTWGAGVDATITPKVIVNSFYSLSVAKNSIYTRAMGSSAISGFLVTTAQDYPDTSNRWHQAAVSVKFPLTDRLAPKFEYRYEKYSRIDFQLERLSQYINLDPSTSTSIFLGVGSDIPGYDAHILAVSLEYRF